MKNKNFKTIEDSKLRTILGGSGTVYRRVLSSSRACDEIELVLVDECGETVLGKYIVWH